MVTAVGLLDSSASPDAMACCSSSRLRFVPPVLTQHVLSLVYAKELVQYSSHTGLTTYPRIIHNLRTSIFPLLALNRPTRPRTLPTLHLNTIPTPVLVPTLRRKSATAVRVSRHYKNISTSFRPKPSNPLTMSFVIVFHLHMPA